MIIVRALAVLLLLTASYLGWWSIAYGQYLWLAAAAVSVAAAFGLILRKRWGAYLWYLIALTASVLWFVVVVQVAISGWPYPDLVSSVISLVPGMALLAVCAFGTIAVARYFRGTRNAL